MTSASVDAVEPIARSPLQAAPLKPALVTQPSRFRRLLSAELSCTHERLVFDHINDVHCARCGKDFTG